MTNWNTRNIINAKISLVDSIAKGLEISFTPSVSSNLEWKSANLNTSYTQEGFSSDVNVNFVNGPTIKGSAVISHSSINIGAEAEYNVQNGEISKADLRFDYEGTDFKIGASMRGLLNRFTGTVYHRLGERAEAATKVEYRKDLNEAVITVGGKFECDGGVCLKGKINNKAELSVCFTEKIGDKISITLSALIDGGHLHSNSGNGHKLGLSISGDA